VNRFSACLLLVCSAGCFAQAPQITKGATVHNDGTKRIPINFHVKSVRYEEDSAFCAPGDCSATKFTIEGYSDGIHTGSRVAYLLTCDQLVANKPTPHIALSCGNIHANYDYDAKLNGDLICFWPEEKYSPPPFRGCYQIVSEKEVSKQSE
jgi:hypothetical protein